MLKILIVVLLFAIIISLFSGLVFLVKDDGKSTRTVNALTVRVTLSVLLLALLVYAVLSGQLPINPSPIR
ncbi:twin transmembrane helix small protein [Alkalimarinus alittae]|uniref:Twin transmembrane helix small protein n=1 Tax=Alkalimarinus alittae TaxID=2961619 RepID=A0ABY6N1X2_9ALTE|nr:twin transmembrane helix small protein [Alkalimarinus alittae]UZE96110.1 twin transmembrane helix small protein [Alkalimarinus alittae]